MPESTDRALYRCHNLAKLHEPSGGHYYRIRYGACMLRHYKRVKDERMIEYEEQELATLRKQVGL